MHLKVSRSLQHEWVGSTREKCSLSFGNNIFLSKWLATCLCHLLQFITSVRKPFYGSATNLRYISFILLISFNIEESFWKLPNRAFKNPSSDPRNISTWADSDFYHDHTRIFLVASFACALVSRVCHWSDNIWLNISFAAQRQSSSPIVDSRLWDISQWREGQSALIFFHIHHLTTIFITILPTGNI